MEMILMLERAVDCALSILGRLEPINVQHAQQCSITFYLLRVRGKKYKSHSDLYGKQWNNVVHVVRIFECAVFYACKQMKKEHQKRFR
jgi:hypothetical protein